MVERRERERQKKGGEKGLAKHAEHDSIEQVAEKVGTMLR